jgi:predicted S18 family serine protease
MMDTKVTWIAIAILVLVGFYNVYHSFLQDEEIRELSEQINELGLVSLANGTIQTGPPHLFISERTIPIVAVTNDGVGEVENLTVRLIPGNSNVLINTNPFLDTSLQYSVNKAVAVAKINSNYGFDRDFVFDYKAGDAQLIGGESAGAAATIATIAALENKTIANDVVITGTVETDGTIGEVGGIIEKAKAVADAGYKRFLVPKGQSTVTYYERQVSEEPTRYGFTILNTRYVPKTIDLKDVAKEEWNLEITEVSTIEEAQEYLIE